MFHKEDKEYSEQETVHALAEEGYRLLSAETVEYTNSVLPLALEFWPEWWLKSELTVMEAEPDI